MMKIGITKNEREEAAARCLSRFSACRICGYFYIDFAAHNEVKHPMFNASKKWWKDNKKQEATQCD